MLVDFIYCL